MGIGVTGELPQEPTDTSKTPIRTRYLDHVTGYQPIRDQYFQYRSVPDSDILTHDVFCVGLTMAVLRGSGGFSPALVAILPAFFPAAFFGGGIQWGVKTNQPELFI